MSSEYVTLISFIFPLFSILNIKIRCRTGFSAQNYPRKHHFDPFGRSVDLLAVLKVIWPSVRRRGMPCADSRITAWKIWRSATRLSSCSLCRPVSISIVDELEDLISASLLIASRWQLVFSCLLNLTVAFLHELKPR